MTALFVVTRYWREIAGGVLLAIVAALIALHTHDRKLLRECQNARLADQQAVLAKTEQATADDLAHARAVETRNATATQETERDLQNQLAGARAAAANYATRLRRASATDPGGGSATGVPAAADAAGGAVDANRAALLDADLRICSENTVKASGWQAWYAKVSAPSD